MKKRTSFKEKGITLIALIVTIIVLLILSGVTITTITGNRGIISKAKDATSKYTQRQAEEQVAILMQEYAMENAEKGTELGDFLEYKKTTEKVIDGYRINKDGSIDIVKDKYLISFGKDLTLIGSTKVDSIEIAMLPKDTDTMIYHYGNIPKDAIEFTVTKDNRGKVGFKGEENEELIIPCAFKDSDGKWYKVIGFEDGCFQETNVKSVTLPYGITKTSGELFAGCEELVSIKAFDGVISIGGGTFAGCTNLIDVSLPNSITNIGSGAFVGCTSLKSIQIPDSVTYIGQQAFSGCTNLTSLTFPNSIEKIDAVAFYGTGLTEINLPESIKYIGQAAFNECNNVQTININYDTLEIESGAFGIGKNIKDINVSGNTLKTLGNCPFVFNGGNPSVTLRSKNANLNVLFQTYSNARIKSANIICDELKTNRAFACGPIEKLTLDCNKACFGEATFAGVENLYFNGTKSKWGQFEFESGWNNTNLNVVHCTDGDVPLH